MEIRLIAAPILSATLLLAGCSGDDLADGVISEPAMDVAVETPVVTEPQSETASPTPTQSPFARFGQTFTYPIGVAITISRPAAYKPSNSSTVSSKASPVAFTVLIKNGSEEIYDPSFFSTSAQSGDTEAEEIFDSANNVDGSPSTKLLPGRSVKFRIAYAVEAPSDIVMEVNPGFIDEDLENTIFTTS